MYQSTVTNERSGAVSTIRMTLFGGRDYSKPCLKQPLNKNTKMVCNTDYRFMQVKSIVEESILQYFRPSLSYHLPLRPLFCIFLSGCLKQVLLSTYLFSLQILLKMV